jgi:hypothetical protein
MTTETIRFIHPICVEIEPGIFTDRQIAIFSTNRYKEIHTFHENSMCEKICELLPKIEWFVQGIDDFGNVVEEKWVPTDYVKSQLN